MTLPLIANIVLAALVLIAIPGMLAWAIRTSRNDGTQATRAPRRPMPRPHFPSPRLSPSGVSPRRPAPDVPGR
jgi:uncharacterized iron-regulated membrane protein